MKTREKVANSIERSGVKNRVVESLRGRWADVFFVFVALVFFAITWPTINQTHDVFTVLLPFLSALAVWPVAVVRYYPMAAWACVFVSCVVIVPLHSNPEFALGWPVTYHLALAICLAAVVLTAKWAYVGWAVLATAFLQLLNPGFEIKLGWFLGSLMFSVLFFLIRWLVLSRRQLATSNVQLARESARSSEQADLRILAEERTKLARDLHDVVAHQMSMIVVQSQSAPFRLQGVTPAIHAEFDSLAETARGALDEVRGLLGVLRSDAESAEVAPVGADQILPTLYAARRSGVDVTWTVTGEISDIDETAGVALQRVLQESLSNASRHAPGGAVVVNLEIGADQAGGFGAGAKVASIEIDSGPAAPDALIAPGTSGGSGIQGMSARVRAVGGAFTALPASDGGFTVTATVPLRSRGRSA